MFYTYVLKCDDGELYVGSAVDLRKRLAQHRAGRVRATAHRLPVRLEYYEACRSDLKAQLREKQLKTRIRASVFEAASGLKVAPRPQRFA